jgi:DNA polymerase
MKTASVAKTDDFGPAPVPATRDVGRLRSAAKKCRACPLWKNATCTVFGEGAEDAKTIFVGEQPGDHEDRAGHPFVGPAGKLLDRALEAADVDRQAAYVTNAVKHFKWKPAGKRRLHAKPSAREMAACRPWLAAEIESIAPKLIVCLGSTAARQVLGHEIKVTQARGEFLDTEWGARALITVHPSSLLRAPAEADRERDFQLFVADLKKIR